jgi:AraC-like DNA-binding protein
MHLLHILLSGKKRVYSGKKVLSFAAGEAFFLKAGHYVLGEILDSEPPFQNLLFYFDAGLLREFQQTYRIKHAEGGSKKALFPVQVTTLIHGFVASVLPLFASDLATNRELLRLKFFELLHYLCLSPENEEFAKFLSSLSRNQNFLLIDIMRSHYTKPWHIGQYAKLAGRSLSSFKREFKWTFGIDPGEWLRKQRLQHAYFLLLQANPNVTEVCFESGHRNLSHFIQSFKKEFGITPKQLAKTNTF